MSDTASRADTFAKWWTTPLADNALYPVDDDGEPIVHCVHADDAVAGTFTAIDRSYNAATIAVFGLETEMVTIVATRATGIDKERHHRLNLEMPFRELIAQSCADSPPAYWFHDALRLYAIEIVFPLGWHNDKDLSRIAI